MGIVHNPLQHPRRMRRQHAHIISTRSTDRAFPVFSSISNRMQSSLQSPLAKSNRCGSLSLSFAMMISVLTPSTEWITPVMPTSVI